MEHDTALLRRPQTEDVFLARRHGVENIPLRDANTTERIALLAKYFHVPRWFDCRYYTHFLQVGSHGVQLV